jgi:general secretion pathway protein D
VPLVSGVTYDNFGNQRNAITYQNVGIILRVTPFITSDGFVEMIVAPEISSVSDSSVNITGGTNNVVAAPLINIRSADTVVVTPDGQTVVIGGLMQTQKIKTVNKVPLLGDIPMLGNLFKHKVTSDAKTELLIFLTPTIVKSPRDLAMVSEAEKGKTRDAQKAFSKDELHRYLDTAPPTPAEPVTSPRGRK